MPYIYQKRRIGQSNSYRGRQISQIDHTVDIAIITDHCTDKTLEQITLEIDTEVNIEEIQ